MPRPYKQYKRRTGRTRSLIAAKRKAYRQGRRSMTIRRPRLPRAVTPRTKFVRMKYVDNITINPGAAGALTFHNFSCNGMYDPDISGSGHQPIGFDQWMEWYDHYHVIGSKITVQCIPSDATNNTVVGIYKNDDVNFLPTQFTHAAELPGSRYRVLATTTSSPSPSPIVLKSKYSAKRDQNSKAVTSDDELRGTVSSNPSEQSYYTIWAASNSTGDPAAFFAVVHIEYLAVLSEPKDFVQS